MSDIVRAAIKSAGGQAAVAKELGIWQTAVSRWCKSGRIPPRRVLDVERMSGVPRHVLAPDLYPQPERAA